MRYICIFLLLILVSCSSDKQQSIFHQDKFQPMDIDIHNVVDHVNPMVGTESTYRLSHGNTYPAIAMPWGMNFWTPQTGKMGNGWAYGYKDSLIRGIKQTHQPSPWINDYGAFSLMAITGDPIFNEDQRASTFKHSKEISKPYYYHVFLEDYDISVEVSPTDRAAMFRFTFPETDNAWIIVDAFNEGSHVRVIPEERKIVGYSMNNSGGVPEGFANYFVITFDHDFEEYGTSRDGSINLGKDEAESDHCGGLIRFKTDAGESVMAKVASSFIGINQAELNLLREVGDMNFEQVKEGAKDYWNQLMSRIYVEDDDTEKISTFYTALYRTMLFPRKFYEYDESGKMVHYSPYNGELREGFMFTDNGFWDTFRAVFPFFTLVFPEFNSQLMQGLVNTYEESGWLPEWASPGHRNCMIGSNSASLIADSYIKGIRGYDIDVLYEAIIKNTKLEGPLTSVGREGVDYYNELGYIPYDVGINENAARSLEYSYADFTIWKLADALGKSSKEKNLFKARAQNYRNLFDQSTNFMRGKNEDGSWQEPFVPEAWGGAFTEGSSWHYTWSVFQDPQGLIDMMGGDETFVGKLDSVFSMPPIFDFTYYGFEIHEITEMVLADMGQYAHGNQPIQHGIYLYNYTSQPWKAQYWLRQVMDKLYSPYPDGLCGDEDNGQTSAWYVFSAMGFYPVCPGQPEYVVGSPLFDKISLNLENGSSLNIEARNNTGDNVYIQSLNMNGKNYTKNYFLHEDLLKGGNLVFEMGPEPNKNRGIGKKDKPYSMTKK